MIRTDHKACTYIQSKSNGKLSLREQRWLDLLADFDCEIDYLQGRLNVVPDSLSRAHMHNTIATYTDTATLGNDSAIAEVLSSTSFADFYQQHQTLHDMLLSMDIPSDDESDTTYDDLPELISDSDTDEDDLDDSNLEQCHFCMLYKERSPSAETDLSLGTRLPGGVSQEEP